MLNQVVLVGRIANDLEIKDSKGILVLAIPRSFKNADGEYETDFINIDLEGIIATNTNEYCSKGDIIGVKGSLRSYEEQKEDGSKIYKTKVIAEKITFLSSRKKDEDSTD